MMMKSKIIAVVNLVLCSLPMDISTVELRYYRQDQM